jgi:hypothetical protein
LLLAPGCSDRSSKERKIRRIEGVATRIDARNNEVSMRYRTEKGAEIILEGSVREDTEISINGVNRKLEDVRVGEHVVVHGYRDRSGDTLKLVATRVEVNRPAEEDWKPTARTTSAPAAASAGRNPSDAP